MLETLTPREKWIYGQGLRRGYEQHRDMVGALRAIVEFEPGRDTWEPHDEWGEAEAWRVARELAASALGVCPWR